MAKGKKNGQTTILIAIIAVVGVAVALFGFMQSKKDKTSRAMWSGLSNLGWPASEYLTYVDLGNVGDDIRYTINNPSGVSLGEAPSTSREASDPNWIDTQMKADAIHGERRDAGDYVLEHTPYEFMIRAPDPIVAKPIIVSAPKVGSNHETVGGNFLNTGGSMYYKKYPGVIP